MREAVPLPGVAPCIGPVHEAGPMTASGFGVVVRAHIEVREVGRQHPLAQLCPIADHGMPRRTRSPRELGQHPLPGRIVDAPDPEELENSTAGCRQRAADDHRGSRVFRVRHRHPPAPDQVDFERFQVAAAVRYERHPQSQTFCHLGVRVPFGVQLDPVSLLVFLVANVALHV